MTQTQEKALRKQYKEDIQAFSLRLIREASLPYEKVTSPDKIVRMINELYDLRDRPEEHAIIIGFDVRMNPVGVFMLAQGNTTSAIVSPPEIFKRLMLCNAHSFALIHNHPSGDCHPSTEDTTLYKRLKKAGDLLNILIRDSIVIGYDKYYSEVAQCVASY